MFLPPPTRAHWQPTVNPLTPHSSTSPHPIGPLWSPWTHFTVHFQSSLTRRDWVLVSVPPLFSRLRRHLTSMEFRSWYDEAIHEFPHFTVHIYCPYLTLCRQSLTTCLLAPRQLLFERLSQIFVRHARSSTASRHFAQYPSRIIFSNGF